MEYRGKNLCDFCFEPIIPGAVCPKCGLSHDTVKSEVGLLKVGTNLLGKYIIGRVLGKGGFGATYLAFSSERNERVAIKEYFPAGIAYRGKDEEQISIVSAEKRSIFQKGAKRFFDEAKTMSRFNSNQNVVSVYEFFYANDTVYYAMEYLDGIDLKGYVSKKGGRISEGEAITVMDQVSAALRDIHSTGTLHRDISPDNIFICTDGCVKLIDFGAAKQVIGEQSQNLSVILKQGFAPVEQYQKDGKQGMWTDIYALGATVYYALTGKVPEDAMSRIENPDIHFDATLGISPQFEHVIDKCMKMQINQRYQNALELQDGLATVPTQRLRIGGESFVQSVYRADHNSGLNMGGSTSFRDYGGNNGGNVYPQSGYGPSRYGNSYIPQPQQPATPYPQSTYGVPTPPTAPTKKSNTGKIAAIVGGAVVVLAIVIILIVKLMSPAQPQPMPMDPGAQQMQGGAPMQDPNGQPMQGGAPMQGGQMPQ